MKSTTTLRVLSLVLGLAVVLGIALDPGSPAPLDVTYRVQVTPNDDFEVELRVRGLAGASGIGGLGGGGEGRRSCLGCPP